MPPTTTEESDWYRRAEAIVLASGVAVSYREACIRALRAIPEKLGPLDRETVAAIVIERASTKKLTSADDFVVLRKLLADSRPDMILRWLVDGAMSIAELRELVELDELAGVVDTMLRGRHTLSDGDAMVITRLLPDLLASQIERVRDAQRILQTKVDRAAARLARLTPTSHAGPRPNVLDLNHSPRRP